MLSYNLNNKFKFLETETGTTIDEVTKRANDFKPVCIPHDWLICHNENYYLDSVGWYKLSINRSDYAKKTESIYLSFDGVYMDTTIYVNGAEAYYWPYGYTAFGFYLDEYLGEGDNEILVRVNYVSPNSRWYSGAGIYRDVKLLVFNESHINVDGLYVHTEPKGKSYEVSVECDTTVNKQDEAKLLYTLSYDGKEVLKTADTTFEVKAPKLWNVYDGNLYELKAELLVDDVVVDELTTRIGFRDIKLDPNKGMTINGKKTVIHGMCMHHDLGCIGSAYNHDAALRQVEILKEMGCNAIRFAHNPPARDFLDITDSMGILVMDEAFDMWKNAKNPYDYARFFDEWHERDIEAFVKRDRNHPSVFMWSIGNEISDTHAREDGIETTRELIDLVRRYDPKGNAYITLASNYMPWLPTQKCMDIIKLAGYNYGEKCYEEHHKKYPDWIIYGSETSSVAASRGVYHFPLSQSVLADDDEQCSALGNSTTSWGAKSTEACIASDRDFKHSLGMFVWSGFDYIGEPTPYQTKNSYLGQIDTAGFPKDAYYIYQSEWLDKDTHPMVHLFPYWDFNKGQIIDLRIASNLDEVELFVNDVSQGRYKVNHKKGSDFVITYQVPYVDGVIKAVGYDKDGNIRATDEHHSFKDSKTLRITPYNKDFEPTENNLIFATIEAIDEDGHLVENAMDYVEVKVSGGGVLIGLDNGDSTDYDAYQSPVRKLFNGKLLAVIRSNGEPKDIAIEASIIKKVNKKPCVPVRNIKLNVEGEHELTPEHAKLKVKYEVLPKNATDTDVTFSIVNDMGIPVTCASISDIDKAKKEITIVANKDGAFRLRAMSKSGTEKIKIISSIEFSAKGLGEALIAPYEFVSAGLYTQGIGEVGNGNERGIASARGEKSGVIYQGVDFGKEGSNKLTLPIFALSDDPQRIQIFDGEYGSGTEELILNAIYHKKMIWNVYQEETYEISKVLTDIHSLSFVFFDKLHLKGFSFIKRERVYEENMLSTCDKVYGDSFNVTKDAIEGIGNNVTIEFNNLTFGDVGADKIAIIGRSSLPVNSIHMLVSFEDGTQDRSIFEFKKASEYTEVIFEHKKIQKIASVKFLFLPGTQFDFKSFRFIKAEG